MTARLLFAVLLAAFAGPMARAADEPEVKPTVKEILRARMAEDAKKKNPAPAPKPAPAPATPATGPAAAATPATKARPDAAKEVATVLPKMEVKKGRITVLDQQLAKQEEDIARERKNLKASEVDLALNDSKIAKPLAIFGGDSSQFRQRVASERVQLMEAEKDILQAIALAKTKQEKQELQKQLDEMRAVRRQLDKTLR